MSTTEVPDASLAVIANTTLSQAPPGITPDLVNPTWHGQGVVIAASIGIPLMFFFASLRIYSRCYLTRKWALDDYALLISLASAIVLISLQLALVCEGRAYGYHAWDVTIGDLTKPVLLRSLVLQVATGPLIWLIKLSLFSLIYNAFHPLIHIRRLVRIGLLLSGLYYIASSIANGIPCGPRGGQSQLNYLAGLASSSCGNPSGIIQIFDIITGCVNLTVDLYLLLIPLRAISELKLPKRRKIGVFLIFLTGGAACVVSSVALYYRSRQFSKTISNSWAHDTTYVVVPLFTVSTVEYTIGVIIPCIVPSAKIFNKTSVQVTSYLSSRFTGFRRTKSIDDLGIEEREMKPYVGGLLVNGKPFSQNDTIDRMLIQIPDSALKSQR